MVRVSGSMMWFRRDLRLADNPALAEAADGDRVVPVYVVDPAFWNPAGAPRRAYLARSLRALSASIGGLVVRRGDPRTVIPALARELELDDVHVTADFGPAGRIRDEQVRAALDAAGVRLAAVDSPYAVAPGQVVNQTGTGYQVFTPFRRAWAEHGWDPPTRLDWPPAWDTSAAGEGLPDAAAPDGMTLPEAGDQAALHRWQAFLRDGLARYAADRDRPDLDGTSHMSVHLKWGEIHPRTMLADLAGVGSGAVEGADKLRSELAWREFYADLLWRRPDTAREYLRPDLAAMAYDEPGPLYQAWCEGRTGYPLVDAGMRQLRTEGWMPNRVRMVAASFLVKDLHVDWRHGARHFMRWLLDGDLASNQHNWQWVAGSGADAAPYFRVFNPITQGKKFDPDGHYIRRHVAELRPLSAAELHRPHDPVVDHAEERREALARLEAVRSR
jgi:deoxyribodipyrimidine photo-lyase